MNPIDRRRFLRLGVAIGSVSIAGCGGASGAPAGASGATAEAAPAAAGDPAAATTVLAPSGPSTPAGTMAFALSSPLASAAAPFTLGFAFRQGDVPAGQGVVGSLADLQVTPKNRWPDGSLKFAVVSGRAPLAANQPSTVTLSRGTAGGGTPLTLTDLKATGVTAAIGCGAFGSVSWTGGDWDVPFQSWIAGPQMSSWIYRKPVGGDAHLTAWLEVRLYAGGAVEVLPWVENGYLRVAAPTVKSATYTFALGGTQRFGAAIDLQHHCRTPLLSGTALSHWLGSDPDVTPKHDVRYLQSSELVPTYVAAVAPSAPAVSGLVATYAPLQRGNFAYSGDDMSGPGYSPSIGLLPQHDMLYLVTTAPSAYGAVVRNGYGAGRYATHYRDETTQRPLRFGSYPHLVLSTSGAGYKDAGASTINQYCPTPVGTVSLPVYDRAHSPSIGYMAYLLTGRWYFMEECQFVATVNYLGGTDSAEMRDGSKGLLVPVPGGIQVRATAWMTRDLANALTVTPDDDSVLRAEFKASLEANVDKLHATYVAGANNRWGFLNEGSSYGGTVLRYATWMNDFCVAVYGYVKCQGFGLANATKLDAFFAWLAQSVVGRLGPGGATAAWYVNAAPYTWAVSPDPNADTNGGTGPWYASWKEMYDATYARIYPGQPWVSTTEGVLGGEYVPGADGYWGNLLPAIAYSVRHGVAGAAEAYARLKGASNWSALLNQFDTVPVWGVGPAA